eukprot:1297145-Rhodomonas_salina.2
MAAAAAAQHSARVAPSIFRPPPCLPASFYYPSPSSLPPFLLPSIHFPVLRACLPASFYLSAPFSLLYSIMISMGLACSETTARGRGMAPFRGEQQRRERTPLPDHSRRDLGPLASVFRGAQHKQGE